VALNKVDRLRLDPRDQGSDERSYELIGDYSGVFGCMTLLGCHDACSKTCRSRLKLSSSEEKWFPWV